MTCTFDSEITLELKCPVQHRLEMSQDCTEYCPYFRQPNDPNSYDLAFNICHFLKTPRRVLSRYKLSRSYFVRSFENESPYTNSDNTKIVAIAGLEPPTS